MVDFVDLRCLEERVLAIFSPTSALLFMNLCLCLSVSLSVCVSARLFVNVSCCKHSASFLSSIQLCSSLRITEEQLVMCTATDHSDQCVDWIMSAIYYCRLAHILKGDWFKFWQDVSWISCHLFIRILLVPVFSWLPLVWVVGPLNSRSACVVGLLRETFLMVQLDNTPLLCLNGTIPSSS